MGRGLPFCFCSVISLSNLFTSFDCFQKESPTNKCANRQKAESLSSALNNDETEYVDSARNIYVVLDSEGLVEDFIKQRYSKRSV